MIKTPANSSRVCSTGFAMGKELFVPAVQIETEAHAAATAGARMWDACPYPFESDAGKHFKRIFEAASGHDI